MDQMRSGDHMLGRFASSVIEGVKRAVTEIGIFTNSKAYKDEIDRYESELKQLSQFENASRPEIEAEEGEVATST